MYALVLLLLVSHACGYSDVTGRYTREIRIKQGALRGVVIEPSLVDNLPSVEAYLGIEYAAPPIGTQRFMPPASPPPWPGVKMADSFAPVCPQSLPDFSSEPGKHMSEARYNSLKRLLPYLSNQSEACLSLNVYTPQPAGSRERAPAHKYPVLVFIHGESYEWNSGNPYDGSVLASYGGVVVVTVNYRLGILGFLKPGLGEHVLSNFGLLDQVAALQWVKDNIAHFNGDPSSVTLMGHGTGAACVNFLLVSPVSHGLFHRAILMSGTALSDWALTSNPIQFTIQVAEALNCPVNDELAGCLRKKRLAEIMRVKVEAPAFRTPFGPVVDGSVVPNEPSQTMGVYRELFSRYELLYGVTEVESYHLLDAAALHHGMLERERDQRLRDYMQARYELSPHAALAAALREYTSRRRPISEQQRDSRPMAEQHRDSLLEALSDAMVASPVSKMADLHSLANPKSYFYVFAHASKHGDFAEASVGGSVHGEELPYVFGVPMNSGRFPQSFTQPEKLFSEAVITYWTNFAKTGNPNAPRRATFLTQGPREWRQYDIDWPEYDVINQTYLNLGIPPKFGHHYRKAQMDFWNTVLPDQLKQPPLSNSRPLGASPPQLRDILPPPWSRPKDRYENFHKPAYGKVVHEVGDSPEESSSTPAPSGPQGAASSAALGLVVIVGVCFLVVNVCVFAALFYQRRRIQTHSIESRSLEGRALESRAHESRTMDSRAQDRRELELRAQQPGVDSHAKVCEWIVQRCPARDPETPDTHDTPDTPDTPDTMTRRSEAETVVPREVYLARQRPGGAWVDLGGVTSDPGEARPELGVARMELVQARPDPGGARTEHGGARTELRAARPDPSGARTEHGGPRSEPGGARVDLGPKLELGGARMEPGGARTEPGGARVDLGARSEPGGARGQYEERTQDKEVPRKETNQRVIIEAKEPEVKDSVTKEKAVQETPDQKVSTNQSAVREEVRLGKPGVGSASVGNVSVDSGDSLLTQHTDLTSRRRKVKKVSVAVDATPAARSASVQKQTPIELTKSLESVDLKVSHAHSRSAPAAAMTTSHDVNVTSRDSNEHLDVVASDPVANMRRRNFPKVLPDLDKRRSLGVRQPPPPPPRGSSTLGRAVKPPRIVIKATPVKRGHVDEKH